MPGHANTPAAATTGNATNTPGRARSALARVAANGTASQQATVKRAVKRKYPSMQVSGIKSAMKGK